MRTSVLIAAFHAGPFIATALESVRAQTHSDWEIIVVEDGSHDATRDIVARFAASCPQRVVYENLGENRGVAAARNRLLELARGATLAFLDADDTWECGHLAAALARIAAGADLVVSGVRTFDLVHQHRLEDVAAPPALVRDPVLTLFQRSAIITSSAVVFRSELAHRAGRFDPTLRIGEDRDYWLRCALALGRFQTTPWFTCNYAKHL
ncbi:MAG TPA: glycosyltransferase family A protein, partial [Opitutus sp.]|nr:glycosyltransferase family A protein [Opitutus sp.]